MLAGQYIDMLTQATPAERSRPEAALRIDRWKDRRVHGGNGRLHIGGRAWPDAAPDPDLGPYRRFRPPTLGIGLPTAGADLLGVYSAIPAVTGKPGRATDLRGRAKAQPWLMATGPAATPAGGRGACCGTVSVAPDLRWSYEGWPGCAAWLVDVGWPWPRWETPDHRADRLPRWTPSHDAPHRGPRPPNGLAETPRSAPPAGDRLTPRTGIG